MPTMPVAEPSSADFLSRLSDADAEVRRIAVMELPYCDEDDILPLLLSALADADALVRAEAAKAIEGFEEPEAVSALLVMLHDSAEDARRIVDAERAAKADHKNGWDGFIRACQQWTEARTEAVRAACRAARDAAPRHLSASGADDFARRAATGAGAEYERTTPRPEWDGVAGYGNNARLEYLREDELTPILGRIRHAVRRRGDETGTTDPSEGVAS